ncbi:hypothetical protein BD311DRAFT_278826 [Dichomitus squalens]|uniref:Uncharacterized protein n=1 Tax=Dichomitus squalens TaxID=114155 RepID=A0A4Q9N1L1_9APHY|nr:hypothetical protein BD311DRAFT_278826 [Dichomitus squalens]
MSHHRNARDVLFGPFFPSILDPLSTGQHNLTPSSHTPTKTSHSSSPSSTTTLHLSSRSSTTGTQGDTSSQLHATSSSASPIPTAVVAIPAGIPVPSTSVDIFTLSQDVTILNTITENITSVTAESSSSSSASIPSFPPAPSPTPTPPPQVSVQPLSSALSHGAVGGIVACLLSLVFLALAALLWHRRKRASAVHVVQADDMRSIEGPRSSPPSTFVTVDDKRGIQGDTSSFPSVSLNRGARPSGTLDGLVASALVLAHQMPVREVDARSVHVSEYWDDRHSDIGGTSGPLPPAYEDVPPRRPFPSSQTNGLRTSE